MALPNVFTSGDVFTAANANLLRSNQYNLTTSTKTANYVLVAGDVGTRVLMNAAGSTTITVNTSLFVAGDTLEIANIGAGVCTITSGTCTVTSSSNLALVQYASGTLFFTSASAAIFIASAVTATAGGLTFITGASFTTAASVSLPTSTFTSTYTNYRILLNVSSASSMSSLRMRFRASGTDNTASNYQQGYMTDQAFANTLTTFAYLTNCVFGASVNINGTQSMDIYNPQSAVAASWLSQGQYLTTNNNSQQSLAGGVLTVTTAYDAITFYGDGNSITGNYKVYGYTNS
jgi:hypothetical protein